MNDRPAIEALWFEPGTAADAAAAANRHRAPIKHISPAYIRFVWNMANKQGRLPPFVRPDNGFSPLIADAVRKIMHLPRLGRVA